LILPSLASSALTVASVDNAKVLMRGVSVIINRLGEILAISLNEAKPLLPRIQTKKDATPTCRNGNVLFLLSANLA
jgi:hypothetical protein